MSKDCNENRIGSERVRIRKNQKELAQLIGVSNKSVSHWERGKGKPSPDLIIKLSTVFGCTTDYLLGCSDERLPPKAS